MTPDEELTRTAVAGVWSTAMANAAGFTRHEIESRRGVVWQTLRRGIFAYAGVEPSPVMRAAAAVLACGGALRPRLDAEEGGDSDPAGSEDEATPPMAVAAGRTSARVWGIPLVDDHDPATRRFEAKHDDVFRRRGQSTVKTLHTRRTRFAAGDVVYVDGVPVLSNVRTLLDLAVVLRPDALVAAIDHALHVQLVQLETLADAAGGGRRGESGAVAFRRALALADGEAESPHESLTRLILRPVLPGLRSQVRVFDDHGLLVARLDLGDEKLRLGVESDGAAYHRGRAAADRKRDYRTGWTIERCSWFETRCEAEQLKQRVLTAARGLSRAA